MVLLLKAIFCISSFHLYLEQPTPTNAAPLLFLMQCSFWSERLHYFFHDSVMACLAFKRLRVTIFFCVMLILSSFGNCPTMHSWSHKRIMACGQNIKYIFPKSLHFTHSSTVDYYNWIDACPFPFLFDNFQVMTPCSLLILWCFFKASNTKTKFLLSL